MAATQEAETGGLGVQPEPVGGPCLKVKDIKKKKKRLSMYLSDRALV